MTEKFEILLQKPNCKIERITSYGDCSPEDFWYDQDESEWVMIIEGQAILEFKDKEVVLKSGDHIDIPAHVKHRVKWTAPEQETVWLAVFY